MIWSNNPVWDAERHYQEQEEARKEWAKGQPFCMVCDERIESGYCYIVDDEDKQDTCICKSCMEGQVHKLDTANINQGLRDALKDYIETMWGRTPRKEWY